MNPKTSKTQTLLAAITGLLLPLLMQAAVPGPPTNVCVDNNCNGTVAPATGSRKWHPGHYVLLDKRGNTGSPQTSHFAAMDALASNPNIKGFQVTFSWRTLETARGVYNTALIQAYLDKVASINKRLMIVIQERDFGTPTGNYPGVLPAYLDADEFGGGDSSPDAGSQYLVSLAKSWDPPVMDRIIALDTALATKFDNNAALEMVSWEGESAVDQGGINGYNPSTYFAQWQRYMAAAQQAWKKTQVRIWLNYSGSQALESSWAAAVASRSMAVGGPDTWNRGGTVWADKVHIGNKWDGSAWTTSGGVDYRPISPWVAEVQSPAYQGSHGFPAEGVTFQQVYDWAFNTMQMSYMVWYRNEWAGDSSQMWPANLAFINAHPTVARTACPSSYASCDTR